MAIGCIGPQGAAQPCTDTASKSDGAAEAGEELAVAERPVPSASGPRAARADERAPENDEDVVPEDHPSKAGERLAHGTLRADGNHAPLT